MRVWPVLSGVYFVNLCIPDMSLYHGGLDDRSPPSPLALLISRILSQFFYLHKLSNPSAKIVHVGRRLHGQTICERPQPKHCDQICHCYFR